MELESRNSFTFEINIWTTLELRKRNTGMYIRRICEMDGKGELNPQDNRVDERLGLPTDDGVKL